MREFEHRAIGGHRPLVNIRVGCEFWRADPMVDQVIADEIFNLVRGGVGKARPKKAELRRRFFGYAAPIPTEADPR
jgi:hypothetical protein